MVEPRWRWFALGALLALAAPAQAPAPPPPTVTLHFIAHWRLLPAGTATLAWSNAGGLRQILFTADASDVVNLFYPLHDRMQTRYQPATFCAAELDNNTVEGRRHRLTHIIYQPDQHQLVLDETDPDTLKAPPKHEIKPIPGCVFDLFSALDYVRARPLKVGDGFDFPVNEGGKTTNVHVAVNLKETVTTPAGTFTTLRVQPTVFNDKVFQRKGKMWVWFTDDARHLLVQIEVQVSWGTIIAQLTN
ncbi:MAG: DUF3108 domain-containing protein [Terriglobales bacterium]